MQPHRWQPPRLPRPWDSPDKNTGVGCHFLLQCMKVKNESEVAQSCQTLSDPTGCSLPGSSAHGIFQARVLELGAIAFSLFKPSVCLLSFAVISQSWVSHWQILLILMTPFFLLSSYFFISRDLTFMPMTLFTGTASQFLGVFSYDLSLRAEMYPYMNMVPLWSL